MRFEHEEAAALRPLDGRPPFRQVRELTRRVHNDGCVDVDTNHYSVLWPLIGAPTACDFSVRNMRIPLWDRAEWLFIGRTIPCIRGMSV